MTTLFSDWEFRGDRGNANLVAFNNLYVNDGGTGTCSGTAPNVLFAYNITTAPGGRIDTSPVLSLDGTQIAFVESVPGSPGFAIFHVLTWHAGDGTLPTTLWRREHYFTYFFPDRE